MNILFESDQLITYSKRVKRNKRLTAKEFTEPLYSLKKYIPYCYYLLDLIVKGTLNSFNRGNAALYVNLTAKTLDAIIGEHQRVTAREILIQLDVIKFNKKYKNKFFSQSYRILKQYISVYKELDIPIRLRGIRNRKIKSESNVSNNDTSNSIIVEVSEIGKLSQNQHSQHLDESISDNRISIKTIDNSNTLLPTCSDTSDTSMEQKLRKKENIYFEPIPCVLPDPYTFQLNNLFKLELSPATDDFLKLENFYNSGFTLAEFIDSVQKAKLLKRKEISFTHSKYRVYHTLNRTKKELRSFMLVDGNPMVEFDYKSSQILHLIYIIENDINSGNINASIDTDMLRSQLYAFKRIVNQGDIYNHFAKHYYYDNKKFLGKNWEDSRDKAKELVLQKYINGGNKPRLKSHKWVRSVFTQITAYIDSINIDNDLSLLANRLMESEGYLVNEIIVNRIIREYPECVLYTVFDSIIVAQAYSNQVHDVMIQESINYLGYRPKIVKKENQVLDESSRNNLKIELELNGIF